MRRRNLPLLRPIIFHQAFVRSPRSYASVQRPDAFYAIYRLYAGCRYPCAPRRSLSLNTATPGSSPLSMRLGTWSGWVGIHEKLQLQRRVPHARIPAG